MTIDECKFFTALNIINHQLLNHQSSIVKL